LHSIHVSVSAFDRHACVCSAACPSPSDYTAARLWACSVTHPLSHPCRRFRLRHPCRCCTTAVLFSERTALTPQQVQRIYSSI
jgi:hypothetical protein